MQEGYISGSDFSDICWHVNLPDALVAINSKKIGTRWQCACGAVFELTETQYEQWDTKKSFPPYYWTRIK